MMSISVLRPSRNYYSLYPPDRPGIYLLSTEGDGIELVHVLAVNGELRGFKNRAPTFDEIHDFKKNSIPIPKTTDFASSWAGPLEQQQYER